MACQKQSTAGFHSNSKLTCKAKVIITFAHKINWASSRGIEILTFSGIYQPLSPCFGSCFKQIHYLPTNFFGTYPISYNVGNVHRTCTRALDWTMVKAAGWLFLCHFWPLLMWVTIFWGTSVITLNWFSPKTKPS